MRFKRSYEFRAARGTRSLVVAPPFQISFDCEKATAGFGLNKLTAKLFGLNRNNRNIFEREPTDAAIVFVELLVGYQSGVGRIFKGTVHRGSNQLTSNGYVTEIECYDGGIDYFSSYTSKVVLGKENAVDAVLADMPNTERGAITELEPLTRPKVLIGNSYKLLYDMLPGNDSTFIDDGKVNMLRDREVIDDFVPVIAPRTGLISTPEKDFSQVTFTTTLNPFVRIGRRIQLETLVSPRFNGVYKVETIAYTGDFEGNDWNQEITGFSNKVSTVIQ